MAVFYIYSGTKWFCTAFARPASERGRRHQIITMDNPVRIDKWLWAARFFKTRSLASAAVEEGKVRLNGGRVKPARHLAPGDTLAIDNGAVALEVVVALLAHQRGPAAVAQTLYCETAESAAQRQAQAEHKKLFPEPAAGQKGRPTKRERRQLDQTRR